MDIQREFLANHYQQIWDGAFDQVRQGNVVIDPLLASRELDERRCITVLIRPSSEVRTTVIAFLDELRRIEPGQYYYDASELHVTVLSLFTATLDYARLLLRYGDYLEAVQAALAGTQGFEIEFSGITLSREAVLIQGYPDDSVLNDLREALRRELRARGLTEGLDGRYLLQTAHMTAVRFRESLCDGGRFAQVLEKYRNYDFGRTRVEELHLVQNDWYMSRQSVEILRRYPLVRSADC